jgi:hypothetical protein
VTDPDPEAVVDDDDDDSVRLPGLMYGLEGAIVARAGRYAHLWCDAAITPMTVDADGVPLELGPTVRFATAGQRRALAARRRLRLPRLSVAHVVVRHPPRAALRTRWGHRSGQRSLVVPPPSRGHPSIRLDDDGHARPTVHLDLAER